MQEYFDILMNGHLDDLHLDEGLNPCEPDTMGYTLKAMASGLWAVKNATSFQDGLHKVIYEGGDADTNGAVAGSLLGARFGFFNIPEYLVKGLIYEHELWRRIKILESLL